MPIIELPGTTESYEASRGFGDYLGKTADAAANFACGLYKNFPGEMVGNPASGAIRGLLDSLCKNRPPGLPAPPSTQFQGGQCDCTSYDVSYTNTLPDGTSTTNTSTIRGKILGMRVERGAEGTFDSAFVEYIACSGDTPIQPPARFFIGTIGNGYNTTLDGVTRTDGLPDECGDPAPEYPPNTYNPPDGWNSGTGSITYNDGTDLTFPLVYAPISPEFSLNPRFNIDVGGVTLQFDLGGVKIDLGNENSDPTLPRDRGGDCGDGLDRVERILDDIGDKIDDIGDGGGDGPGGGGEAPPPPEAPPPDSDPEIESEPKTENDPKEESGVERLKWVKIILTKLPDKVQYGDGAPNCYFAGWIEFKSGDACFVREQINFQRSMFLAPAGADGYAYTLTNGAEGYAIVYKKKEPE